MKLNIFIALIVSVVLQGCATSSSSYMSNEDFERLKNGDAVIVNNRQSHGLIGEAIHNTLSHP